MNSSLRDAPSSLGLLILRIGMGGYMLTHGVPKVRMLIERQPFGDPIGIGPELSLVLVVFAEVVCAALVVLGLATRFAAVPVVITMLVAAFVVHGADPWTMGAGASKQPALLFATGFLTLAFTGAGGFSLDAWLRRKRAAQR